MNSKIKVYRFEEPDSEKWDHFVENSNNGTLFHLRTFLSYHIDRQFEDHSLIFKKKSNIIAVFPAAKIRENQKKILYSHPGASYGGFVYQKLIFNDAEAIIDLFENYLQGHGFDKTFFIPTPSIYFKDRDETIEYALLWRDYKPVEHYISSVIPIHTDIEKNLGKRNYLKLN